MRQNRQSRPPLLAGSLLLLLLFGPAYARACGDPVVATRAPRTVHTRPAGRVYQLVIHRRNVYGRDRPSAPTLPLLVIYVVAAQHSRLALRDHPPPTLLRSAQSPGRPSFCLALLLVPFPAARPNLVASEALVVFPQIRCFADVPGTRYAREDRG